LPQGAVLLHAVDVRLLSKLRGRLKDAALPQDALDRTTANSWHGHGFPSYSGSWCSNTFLPFKHCLVRKLFRAAS
jgi:hypothetical protein